MNLNLTQLLKIDYSDREQQQKLTPLTTITS